MASSLSSGASLPSTLPTTADSIAPEMQKKTSIIKKVTSLSYGKAVLLMGLVFMLVIGSVGLLFARMIPLTIHSTTSGRTPSPTTLPRPIPINYAMFGFNPQHSHFNPSERVLSPTNVSRLLIKWSTSTGGTGDLVTNSSPAVVEGIVYIASEDHNLYALNAETGQVIWIGHTKDFIVSSPAVADGVVYIGSYDHSLYALNAETGKVIWTEPTQGSIILSSPAVAGNTVYVGSQDHNLYAFNAKTGATMWVASTGTIINTSPTVANGVVYVGSDKLYAFDAMKGKLLWTALAQVVYSSAFVVDGVVYVGYYHRLYAFYVPGV